MAPQPSKLDLTQIRTIIKREKIDENLDIRSGKAKANKLRNDVIRKTSDYISEQVLGRKITKQEEQLFTTPQAAPDAILNADEFAYLTGINVNQSNILKDLQLQKQKSQE